MCNNCILRLVLLLLFIGSLNVAALYSQKQIIEFPFEKLKVAGKSNYSSVFAVTIDPFGFLWIGSGDGLIKYEGNRFITKQNILNDSLSLPANKIYNVFSDNAGNIFVSCFGKGLYMMWRRNQKFYSVKDEINNIGFDVGSIREMVSDTNNVTWVATSSGVCSCELIQSSDRPKFNIDCQLASKATLKQFQNQPISGILYTKEHEIWMSSNGSIYQFNPYNDTAIDTILVGKEKITHMFESNSNEKIILKTGERSVLKWSNKNLNFDTLTSFRPQSVRSAKYGAYDHAGKLWVSELGYGMHVLDNNLQHRFLVDNSKVNIFSELKYIRKPVKDKAENIWWPASDEVRKMPARNKVIHSFRDDSHNFDYASALYRQEDILWVGTQTDGLIKINLKTYDFKTYDIDPNNASSIPDDRVYDIYPYGSGSLVVLTRSYLSIFDIQTEVFEKHRISNGPIRSTVIDEKGAYITHSGSGIFYLDFETGLRTHLLNGKNGSAKVGQCYHILQGAHGVLWLSTLGEGLVKFDPISGKIDRYKSKKQDINGISSNTVNMSSFDNNGKLWLATNEGLNIFDPVTERFEILSEEDGLSSNLIYSIVMDKQGIIWCTAGNGVHAIDPLTNEIRTFNDGDGLANYVFYPRSIHCDEEGYIYIGGKSGFDYFHPSEMGMDTIPPKIWITSIDRDIALNYSHTIEELNEIVLSPSEDFVNISFASTHFLNPEAIEYSYRLVGLDQDWVQLGKKNDISLVGLKPGVYNLEISCKTSENIAALIPAKLKIKVLAPFYNRAWFYGIISLILGYGVYWFIRNQTRQIKRESDFKQQLAESEMKALRSQMNPHFIFNSLNSIKSYIVDNDPKTASNYLTKFAHLMRHILNHSKAGEIPLEEELSALQLYIELEQIRFSHRFEYALDIDQEMNAKRIAIQPLLIQPFVENAIWHGLLHLKGLGKLYINVKEDGGFINIEIRDNGVGRKNAISFKSKSAQRSKSYGMEITVDRLTANYQDRYSLEIFDGADEAGKVQGTVVKLSIPKNYI